MQFAKNAIIFYLIESHFFVSGAVVLIRLAKKTFCKLNADRANQADLGGFFKLLKKYFQVIEKFADKSLRLGRKYLPQMFSLNDNSADILKCLCIFIKAGGACFPAFVKKFYLKSQND